MCLERVTCPDKCSLNTFECTGFSLDRSSDFEAERILESRDEINNFTARDAKNYIHQEVEKFKAETAYIDTDSYIIPKKVLRKIKKWYESGRRDVTK
jgi:hypothetical protein